MILKHFAKYGRKGALLASLFVKQPTEFYDRLSTIVDAWSEWLWIQAPDHEPKKWEEVISAINALLGTGAIEIDGGVACLELAKEIHRQMDETYSDASLPVAMNADITLASFCYGICRAFKPSLVLETGVAYGVTSAFILQALATNGHGILHSIDLPPLEPGADQFVGAVIPERLKDRWCLHRGASKRVLPLLLEKHGHVDVFVHDSLHTYKNISRELDTVTPHLASNAIVIADDVEGNRAFLDWVKRVKPAFWAIMEEKEKKSLCGVAIFRDSVQRGNRNQQRGVIG